MMTTTTPIAPIREPAVAGAFYPDDPKALEAMVRRLVPRARRATPAIGVVCPHAGYQYSGSVAGSTLARTVIPERVILLGPNHTGFGAPFSIMTRGAWRTPLGEVPIDGPLADELVAATGVLQPDEAAHRNEHSIEVQLPLLQHLQPAVRIVPIILTSAPWEAYHRIGQGIAEIVRRSRDPVLLVASSDLTHYEPQETAKTQDAKALAAIEAVDPERLMKTVLGEHISMCGYAPTTAMLVAARALGAIRGELVEYRTSGDETGDYESVVGYAGVIIRGGS